MALDMYNSDTSSMNTSPRLSFSHNLPQTDHTTTTTQTDHHPYRLDSSLLDSNPEDFDFSVTQNSIEIEPSPADELFSDGLILPLQLQQRFITSTSQLPPLPTLPKNQETSKAILLSSKQQNNHPPNSNSKSFWRIKRSSSLHVDNSYKKSSFWSSLPLLSRSNSTGSVSSPKQSSQRHQKNSTANPNHELSSSFYMYVSSSSSSSQKPPLKRNYGGGGSYGNNGRISPILNVPPPFISKGTASLFGFGSFFGNGNDKKNKKLF